MLEITKSEKGHLLTSNKKPCALIPALPDAEDRFERIEDGVWKWVRRTKAPVDRMRMEAVLLGEPTFTMVPAVSYNGNGWGSLAEYVGDRAEDGTPWSWASHRVTIPACTYSENAEISVALMSEPNDNTACSLYRTEEGEKHVVIFPEEEKPKTLHRHFWGEPFQGTMEPRSEFTAILFAAESDGSRHRYKTLLDFAWRYYGHPIKPPKSAAELYRLSVAYSRYLLQKERNGFTGFASGAQWYPNLNAYEKAEYGYELGWVGQNASFAAASIYDSIRTGDKDSLETGVAVLDSWIKVGVSHSRFLLAHRGSERRALPLPRPIEQMSPEEIDPWIYGECKLEGLRERAGKPLPKWQGANDACNLGTGAEGYFEAYDLLKTAGIDKPEYLEAALNTCDFALESQGENGAFAKSWDNEGKVWAKDGTIGCFLILPLINAYKRTKKEKYLTAAVRAFDFYYQGLERDGFTTAGALDTYSIDKESSSPLLRDALALYDVTGDKAYVARAEKIAWYLSTWLMYYTIEYPEDCLIRKLGYDTFGATSVSTPHQALDQYALRDVLSFIRLSELTGNTQWRERALAMWCNSCQGISDGTLYVNKRLRPAGSQDEAIYHTRWGGYAVDPFHPSQWLASWPCAFRLENLRWHPDWSFFDEGLTGIKGALR